MYSGTQHKEVVAIAYLVNYPNRVIHRHMHLEAAHLVGLMRGLLPKRNDGRTSETVPFRRRNFSVRSKPADGFIKKSVTRF